MDASERLCLLGLSHVEFLHPRETLALVEMLGNAARIFELTLQDIASLIGRRIRSEMWNPHALLRLAEQSEKSLTGGALGCIFYWDAAYPPQLREIYDPPVTLFYRGMLPDNGQSLAGIVGTRFPTGAGIKAACRLGFELALEGVGVVSGLARGIDREAHGGCLAAGGYSIAVLGNGIDSVYPVSSRAMGRALLDKGGCILSEYPPGIPPLAWHFPARNRIISGLCRSVVVVQAPEKSGALITADYALEQGRDLSVHQAGLAGSAGAGTRRLAESGAPVIEAGADIVKDWGLTPRFAREAAAGEAQNAPTGEILARMVQEEIQGSCALRGGETYWRA